MSGAEPPAIASLLRHYRREAGLTQEELAERAGLSVRGISDLERGLKRAPHPSTLQLLADALELSGEQRRAFLDAVARRRGPLQAQDQGDPSPLRPIATALVGRDQEEADIMGLLREDGVRLLTLTGPGGVGKTHLALRIASLLEPEFPDGVARVALAPVLDARVVLVTMARELGILQQGAGSVEDLLLTHLRERRTLLVLDNLEQVLDVGPFLAALVAACREVTLLVTSREPLHVRGEQVYPVEPLSTPLDLLTSSGVELSLDRIRSYPAVELFLQRARAVTPRFRPSEDDALPIARICVELDGLPLAIELAATHMATSTPHLLQEQLKSRLSLLRDGPRDLPARQRTMRDTIAWSYGLLSEVEQRVFRAVSVFVGGFDLEIAQEVVPTIPADLHETLMSLIRKNLLYIADFVDGSPRFGMLETIREYGLERLAESGEADATRRRHARSYLALVERSFPEMSTDKEGAWIHRLEREHDNVRAVLRWSLHEGDTEVGLRTAGKLWKFWWSHGHMTEGRSWLAQLLERAGPGDETASAGVRGQALFSAGAMAYSQGTLDQAEACWEEALPLHRSEENRLAVATTLNALGSLALSRDKYESANKLLEETATLQRELGNRFGLGAALNNLGEVARRQGRWERSRTLFDEAISIYGTIGSEQATAVTLGNVAELHNDRGQAGAAVAAAEESLRIARAFENVQQQARALTQLARAAELEGEDGRARELHEEALELFRSVGNAGESVWNLLYLGVLALRDGDVDRGGERAREAHMLAEESRARRETAAVLQLLGDIACREGRLASAEMHYRESHEIYAGVGRVPGLAAVLERLAHVALLRGDIQEAGRRYGEASNLREELGTPISLSDRHTVDEDLVAIRRAPSDEAIG